MIDDIGDAIGISGAAAIAVAIILVIQIGLQIYALVDLLRRPAALVRPNKWLWVLIIVFGNLAGAVIYLALGRPSRVEVVDPIDPESISDRDRAQRAADLLYGPDKRS